jgi:hypothetical protein
MTKSDLKIHVIMVVSLMFLFLAMSGLIYLGNTLAEGSKRVYNCSIAEISPDFTTAMREMCRKQRMEQK